MAAALPVDRPAARAPLSALARWTVATLAVGVVLLVYMQIVLFQSFDPPLVLIFGVPAVLFALPVLFIRRRWASLFGALYWALFLAANAPYLAHDLIHPEVRGVFMFMIVLTATALVGLVAGIGAALTPTPALPNWFANVVKIALGVSLGAILVAALPRASGAGVDPATLAGLPALKTAQVKFDQSELHAKVGEAVALRLENADPGGHSFDIDALNVHVSMPPGEPVLALFTPTQPGTYEFYCSVPGHREAGMVGTLVVEP